MKKVINKKSILSMIIFTGILLVPMFAFAAETGTPAGDPGTLVLSAINKLKHLIWKITLPGGGLCIMITYLIQKFSFGNQKVIDGAMEWRRHVWQAIVVIMAIDVIMFFISGLLGTGQAA